MNHDPAAKEERDDREAVARELMRRAPLPETVARMLADAVLACLRDRGWSAFGAAEEYVDFLIRQYPMSDDLMTQDAIVVRDKLRHLMAPHPEWRAAVTVPRDVAENAVLILGGACAYDAQVVRTALVAAMAAADGEVRR